jgi:hypothetical protein
MSIFSRKKSHKVSYDKPAPLHLSPAETAIKKWFDSRSFSSNKIDIQKSGGDISIYEEKFLKLSDRLYLTIHLVGSYVPGNAQVEVLYVYTSPDCLHGKHSNYIKQNKIAQNIPIDRSLEKQQQFNRERLLNLGIDPASCDLYLSSLPDPYISRAD